MHFAGLVLLALASLVSAQFGGFFDQMFGGGGQQHHQPQNAPSDSAHYRSQYAHAHCDNYLCPDTLGTFSGTKNGAETSNPMANDFL